MREDTESSGYGRGTEKPGKSFSGIRAGRDRKRQAGTGRGRGAGKQYRKLSNGRLILETLQTVRSLTGYDSGQGAGESIGTAVKELSRVSEYDPQLETMENSIQEIDALLNDFNRELSSYVEEMTFDSEAFYETEKRLDLLNGLKAKYGRTIEDILAYQKEQQKKLEDLEKFEERFHEARQNLEKARKELEKYSYDLSEIRKEYSSALSEKILEGLRDLNFLDVKFRISFQKKKEFTDNGYDDIEYEISTNPGEDVKPLAKIVSGGELSGSCLP